MRVLPEISKPSAPGAVVSTSTFFIATLFVAASAIGEKFSGTTASATMRRTERLNLALDFITGRALQRDVQRLPWLVPQSQRFLLHQILRALRQLHL